MPGAERVVVMGHSFGGAVAMRTAVIMPVSVVGVVTFATQSAGCEVAGALAGRPLLLFHGDRDELLPAESSHVVAAIAGAGEVVMLPGDGHLLAKSDDVITERLDTWLPETLGIPNAVTRTARSGRGRLDVLRSASSAARTPRPGSRCWCRTRRSRLRRRRCRTRPPMRRMG